MANAVIEAYYTLADEEILNITQSQIASAIALKRLELKGESQALARSKQISNLSAIFTELDLKMVLEKAVAKVPELCRGLNCSIFLWNELHGAFVLEASTGLPAELVGNASYQPGEGLTGWVGLHGKTLILDSRALENLKKIHPDLAWKGKYNEDSLSKSLRPRPFLAVPIFRDGKPIGVIRICDRQDGVFTESDAQMLTLVAGHITTAITYCDRYEDKVKLLHNLRRLMVLTSTKGISQLNVGVDEFEQSILEEAAKSAEEVLKTDVLTLYKYRVKIPAASCGAFRDLHQTNSAAHFEGFSGIGYTDE